MDKDIEKMLRIIADYKGDNALLIGCADGAREVLESGSNRQGIIIIGAWIQVVRATMDMAGRQDKIYGQSLEVIEI